MPALSLLAAFWSAMTISIVENGIEAPASRAGDSKIGNEVSQE